MILSISRIAISNSIADSASRMKILILRNFSDRRIWCFGCHGNDSEFFMI